MRNELDALLGREMTRKEFVQHVGYALLVAIGVAKFIGALQPKTHARQAGYGSSAYGGARR